MPTRDQLVKDYENLREIRWRLQDVRVRASNANFEPDPNAKDSGPWDPVPSAVTVLIDSAIVEAEGQMDKINLLLGASNSE